MYKCGISNGEYITHECVNKCLYLQLFNIKLNYKIAYVNITVFSIQWPIKGGIVIYVLVATINLFKS